MSEIDMQMTADHEQGCGSNRLPVLGAEIRKAHADVQEAVKTAAQRAIYAGNLLIEAKELVKHGEWLPWLREHCALAERTAQLYMRVAKSGVDADALAHLGLTAASKAIVLEYPDPFAEMPEPQSKEWLLWRLMMMRIGCPGEDAESMAQRLVRIGFASIAEWYSEDGDKHRSVYKIKAMGEDTKSYWHAFLAKNLQRSIDDIGNEILHLCERQPEPTKRRRSRKRKSATVADLMVRP